MICRNMYFHTFDINPDYFRTNTRIRGERLDLFTNVNKKLTLEQHMAFNLIPVSHTNT